MFRVKDHNHRARRAILMVLANSLLLLSACRQAMANQAKVDPLEPNSFFEENQSARPLVDGTVPNSYVQLDGFPLAGDIADEEQAQRFFFGEVGGQPIEDLPIEVTFEVLQRGQSRYTIYCQPCHGGAGEGNGPVVLRGFPAPPSLLMPRLVEAPVGHLFGVITHGIGLMLDYAAQVQVADRWAISAYIRVLQWSRLGPEELTPEQRELLEVWQRGAE